MNPLKVSTETLELIDDWLYVKGMAKKYSDDAEAFRKRVLEAITDPETGEVPEHVEYQERLLLKTSTVTTERIDSVKLRARYPDIAAQFSKASTSVRMGAP